MVLADSQEPRGPRRMNQVNSLPETRSTSPVIQIATCSSGLIFLEGISFWTDRVAGFDSLTDPLTQRAFEQLF